jgi:dephospho-CoA kinase
MSRIPQSVTSRRSRTGATRRTRKTPPRTIRPGSKTPRRSPPNLVVGLTGPNASGKGEVAKFLASRGFSVHSLSDVVRREAARLGLRSTRGNLIRVGVRLRAAGGPGALARRVLPRLGRRAVVDSIRNPGEVAVLRRLPRFLLLGIDAPLALRFERSLRRGRLGDGATLQEFADHEARENSRRESGQQLLATLALADDVIDNDGTIAALRARARATLRRHGVRV